MTTKIYICSNNETICDGYVDSDDCDVVSAAYQDAATRVLCFAQQQGRDVDLEFDGNFHAWHGGKHEQVGKSFGGKTYGYRSGLVSTQAADPPEWLRDLIDRADAAGSDARQIAADECERQLAESSDEE